ncbi:hypothetical protein NQ314_012489 [Rhamnusium bicolor]|uniref:Peptidase aspartic putative domain-containing protein n=1 Tax=Rhamnusium bicolor TaxID=1586634 RepID=A0AAV8XBD5_9CUCU|nr:hypothetical protein NQ314_012489 [Rhamnusium bicolor]
MFKRALMRFENYFNTFDKENLENSIVLQLKVRFERLVPALDEFNQANIPNITQASSPVVIQPSSPAVIHSNPLVNRPPIKLPTFNDSGSQSNFISERMCVKLDIQKCKMNHVIKGVGSTLSNISSQVNITIGSSCSDFSMDVNCLILPKITDELPVLSFNKQFLNIPSHLIFADPSFNVSQEIDVLLGIHVFWSIIRTEQERLGPNLPVLQNSELGYIIAGNLQLNSQAYLTINCLNFVSSDTSISDIIKFWEREEENNKKLILSESEQYCEKFYEQLLAEMSDKFNIQDVPRKHHELELVHTGDPCSYTNVCLKMKHIVLYVNSHLSRRATLYITHELQQERA